MAELCVTVSVRKEESLCRRVRLGGRGVVCGSRAPVAQVARAAVGDRAHVVCGSVFVADAPGLARGRGGWAEVARPVWAPWLHGWESWACLFDVCT